MFFILDILIQYVYKFFIADDYEEITEDWPDGSAGFSCTEMAKKNLILN